MSPDAQPLPMAPSGCALDESQLAEQLARYRHLSASVLNIDQAAHRARIRFDERVDPALLEQTLAVERGCCGFLTLDYAAPGRVLTVTSSPEHGDALSALVTALTPASGSAAAQRDRA